MRTHGPDRRAIHLTAAAAGEELAVVVTYDSRMADAARATGFVALAPGAAQ